jgi:hypothetical protein
VIEDSMYVNPLYEGNSGSDSRCSLRTASPPTVDMLLRWNGTYSSSPSRSAGSWNTREDMSLATPRNVGVGPICSVCLWKASGSPWAV